MAAGRAQIRDYYFVVLAYESYDNFIAFNNTIAYFNAKLYDISTKEIHLDIPVKKRVIKIQMPFEKQETWC